MAKVKSLVATDSRFPLTVALAEAVATGQFSVEVLALRKKELTDLISESAKMFGFKSKTSLTDALDFSIGLLSLALVHSTRGENLPGTWAERLVTQSWKGLVKESISMIRAVKEQDAAHVYLFEGEKDPQTLRDHLRDFGLRRDSHRQWVGYQAFLHYQESRAHHQAMDGLVRSLIKTLYKRPLHWNHSGDGPACADEALNTLLFRSCTGLGFNQKDIILTEKEFRQVRGQYDDDPAKWLKDGQKRFELLQLSVPEEWLRALDQDWFQKHFKKGPPKVKKWDLDDLPDITGVYYYQTYM